MEFKIKEESSFLPHDLIDDIENDSLDSTEEISNIINRPEEINQFNSQFNNSIYEQNFNHYKSFSNLPFLTYFQNFQTEKNYPDLIAYNIPKVLKDYPKLKRRDLFDVFILFKNLLKFCVSYNLFIFI